MFRSVVLSLGFAVVVLGTGCASEGASEDQVLEGDEASDDLGARPKYTRRNTRLLGEYAGDGDCGDSDVCNHATLANENGEFVLYAGVDYGYRERPRLVGKNVNGVFLFDTGDQWGVPGYDDCDNPGCSDLMRVQALLYPKKSSDGETWVPTLRLTVDKTYSHPDEEDAPQGDYRYKTYLTRTEP